MPLGLPIISHGFESQSLGILITRQDWLRHEWEKKVADVAKCLAPSTSVPPCTFGEISQCTNGALSNPSFIVYTSQDSLDPSTVRP